MTQFVYPHLSSEQQTALPALIEPAIQLPTKFDDSTHRLWRCVTVDGDMVLKVCNTSTVAQSRFWLGMNALFELDFPNSLGQIINQYAFLQQHGEVQIPEYISAASVSFVLVRFVEGVDVTAETVRDGMVEQIAHHIAKLHSQTFDSFGALPSPSLAVEQWPRHLQNTLTQLAASSPILIPDAILIAALEQAAKSKVDRFVPIMPDLRWDQCRHYNQQLCLVDVDAVVIGPAVLELVLLEYLLNASQWQLFVNIYQQYQDFPDYSQQRECYQLLLFLMNVLGETHLERWMSISRLR